MGDEGAGGAGGGAGGHVQSAGVANTLWASTMRREPGGGLDGGAGGAGGGAGGHVQGAGVANTLWAYAKMGREPGAGVMRELEGAGGHVERAGGGKHAVGVCDDGAGARGGLDEGAGGAGGGTGRHIQSAGGGKHAVGVCDDKARARGGDDERAGGAGGGAGGHVQPAGLGKHAVGGVCVLYLSRPSRMKSMRGTPSTCSMDDSTLHDSTLEIIHAGEGVTTFMHTTWSSMTRILLYRA
jgi:hypothetical protein